MKKVNYLTKAILAFIAFSPLQQVFAQAKVEVNGHDVGSWFNAHWIWVAGAVVVLIILLLLTSSSSKQKSTTIVKDSNGNVKNITTTERIEDL